MKIARWIFLRVFFRAGSRYLVLILNFCFHEIFKISNNNHYAAHPLSAISLSEKCCLFIYFFNHHADRCHMPVWSWWFDVNMWRWCGAPYPICINVGSGAAAAAAEAAEADPRPTAAAAACISAAEPQTSSGERAYSGLTPWWLKWWPAVLVWWPEVSPCTSNREVMPAPEPALTPVPPTMSWSPWWPLASGWWWPPLVPVLPPTPLPPTFEMGLPSLTKTGTATLRGEFCEVCQKNHNF